MFSYLFSISEVAFFPAILALDGRLLIIIYLPRVKKYVNVEFARKGRAARKTLFKYSLARSK